MSSAVPFGTTPDGKLLHLHELAGPGLRVRITEYGGRMVALEAPDRAGRWDHVLLGFDDAATYLSAPGAFGALLGRTANRIADGRMVVDGVAYALSRNEPGATLHGGAVGFDKVVWTVRHAGPDRLELTHVSPDGDQGFPGTVAVEAVYQVSGDALRLTFSAETDWTTPLSLSAHPYFNLGGPAAGDVLDHEVTIPAERFLSTDARQIPTGALCPVAGTPFDFRTATPLGARIRTPDAQLRVGRGYDHYYVLDDAAGAEPRLAARVHHRPSGRTLELWTTQPGVQLYTGNRLDGGLAGRGGAYRQSAGLALEPQGFPDAVNQPAFPSSLLRPGERYRQVIEYRLTAA